MNLTLLTLVPYLVGLAGLGTALFLFLQLKRMQLEFQTRWNKRQQLLQSELGKTRSLVQELAQRVEEAERRAEISGAPSTELKGINLNRRTQAMRLFRRGGVRAENAVDLQQQLGVALRQPEAGGDLGGGFAAAEQTHRLRAAVEIDTFEFG
jgi:hypothetical protein